MADTPEIPEAKDRFEMLVAMTIAVMAVILSWISNHGDDAKTSAIIKTNEATNKWGHFQSKSIKEKLVETSLDMVLNSTRPATSGAEESPLIENLQKEARRYRTEKSDVQQEAENLQSEAAINMRINDRCGAGGLMLQVAIVISSVSILARSRSLWLGSVLLAFIGSLVGISSHFM